jgi:nuclear pore complex protein Nup205
MLLLVLWRHLLFYSENNYAGGQKANALLSLAVRTFAASDPMDIRAEVGRKLAPILQQLTTLDTVCTLTKHQ